MAARSLLMDRAGLSCASPDWHISSRSCSGRRPCLGSSSVPVSTANSRDGMWGSSGASVERRTGLVIRPFIPESLTMWDTCSGNNWALIGTKTPPAWEMAKMDSTCATEGSR
jgi:hypothetical protein